MYVLPFASVQNPPLQLVTQWLGDGFTTILGGSCMRGVFDPQAALTLVIAAFVRMRFSSWLTVRILET